MRPLRRSASDYRPSASPLAYLTDPTLIVIRSLERTFLRSAPPLPPPRPPPAVTLPSPRPRLPLRSLTSSLEPAHADHPLIYAFDTRGRATAFVAARPPSGDTLDLVLADSHVINGVAVRTGSPLHVRGVLRRGRLLVRVVAEAAEAVEARWMAVFEFDPFANGVARVAFERPVRVDALRIEMAADPAALPLVVEDIEFL